MLVIFQSLSGALGNTARARLTQEVLLTLLTLTLLKNSKEAKQEEHHQALPVTK